MRCSGKNIEKVISEGMIKCPGCSEHLEVNTGSEDNPLETQPQTNRSNDETLQNNSDDNGSQSSPFREQDLLLPPTNIMKVMKSAKLGKGKISKQSKEFMQECVTEFILFITSAANEYCYGDGRKLLNCDDILMALGTLGFDNYVEPLKNYLEKYREVKKKDYLKSKENMEIQQAEIISNEQFKFMDEHEMYRYSTIIEEPCEDNGLFIEFELSGAFQRIE